MSGSGGIEMPAGARSLQGSKVNSFKFVPQSLLAGPVVAQHGEHHELQLRVQGGNQIMVDDMNKVVHAETVHEVVGCGPGQGGGYHHSPSIQEPWDICILQSFRFLWRIRRFSLYIFLYN